MTNMMQRSVFSHASEMELTVRVTVLRELVLEIKITLSSVEHAAICCPGTAAYAYIYCRPTLSVWVYVCLSVSVSVSCVCACVRRACVY